MIQELLTTIWRKILRISRRAPQSEWQLDEYQRAFCETIAESFAEADLDVSDNETLLVDSHQDAIDATAEHLLSDLKKRWPKQLRRELKLESGFRKRTYARWKDGIDLLRMIIVISHEVAARFNEIHRPTAAENNDFEFEALTNLHARALRVCREIVALLENGYPDGALSRWRTLHEIATIMMFLRTCDDAAVAERFLLHKRVTAYQALKQYCRYQDRAGLEPISDEELEFAKEEMSAVVERFGKTMETDYGWAAEALGLKRPSLFHLEEYVGLDHWRPRFKWACDDIHGSYRATGTTLGEAESVSPGLLAGASNSAFTEPAHMMSTSLQIVNSAILLSAPTLDLLAILKLLSTLTEEVGSTFMEIEAGANL